MAAMKQMRIEALAVFWLMGHMTRLNIVHAMNDTHYEYAYKVISYNIAPYIYRDKVTGTITGIFPEIGKLTEFFCQEHIPSNAKLFDFAIMLNELSELSEIFRSNLSYGDGILKNVTANNGVWFPYFSYIGQDDLSNFKKRNVTLIQLTELKYLVVVIQKWKMSLGYKFWLGVYSCRVLVFFTICFSIFCALVIWLLERKNNENIPSNFYQGLGNSLYLITVTLVTVGYGDITPKRPLSKAILIGWMVLGLFLSSLMTAHLLDTINNSVAHDINGKKVAIIRDSYELNFIRHNFNSQIIPTETNEEAVEMVRSGKVFAAVMNSEIASWSDDIILSDGTFQGRLDFSYTLPTNIPVYVLMNLKNPATAEISKCMKNYKTEIKSHSEGSFKRPLHVTKSKEEGFMDIIRYPAYAAIIAVTVVAIMAGMIYHHGIAYRKKKIQKKTWKRKPNEEQYEVT